MTGGPGLETVGPFMEGIWAEKKIKKAVDRILGSISVLETSREKEAP